MIEKSRFHWLLSGEVADVRNPWDEEVKGTRSFAVMPSLGSLVPGWLLVVPRRPLVSLRDLDESETDELIALVGEVSKDLKDFAGTVFAFEHGSARRGSLAGCGVDQAHLHLVPLCFDLVEYASSRPQGGVAWTLVERMSLTSLPSEGEYIAVWQVDSGKGAIGTVKRPVSQWMRRLIAGKLGIDQQWDYRTNPQMDNILETVEKLRRSRSLTM